MPQSKSLQNKDLAKITTMQQLIKAVTIWGQSTKEKGSFELEITERDESLVQLYGQIKDTYIKDLDINKFSEIYIQTAICILFLIKIAYKSKYSINDLSTTFPKLHPVLISLFQEITQTTNPNFMQLMNLFNKCDVNAILEDFTHLKTEIEITAYFYEHLLKEYNPTMKIQSGIFHTPTPVIAFIVRSIDYLLRTEFDCRDGLVDPAGLASSEDLQPQPNLHNEIRILDPAMGTGAFLETIVQTIKAHFDEKYQSMSTEDLRLKWSKYVDERILRNLSGFELELPPYIIAQLKLSLVLKETGYDFASGQQLQLLFTNTLTPENNLNRTTGNKLPSQESGSDNKKAQPRTISVVLGNPPYSRSSKNTGKYIESLMASYKHAVQQEKNIQPLSDDYIKFIRFAQDRIEKTGQGIIGMITNHTYLTGIIYSGMRQELMKAFDRIYILDLHGSKIIHENVPNEVKDENIFAIKQGICIALFVKAPKIGQKEVFHFDLFGSKISKLDWLTAHEISTIPWTNLLQITPGSPFSHPSKMANDPCYENYPSLAELFMFYNVGGKPGDDKLLVALNPKDLNKKLSDFIASTTEKAKNREYTEAQRKLLKDLNQFAFDPAKIEPYNYRPFDVRWIYYDPNIWTRPVTKLKAHCTNNLLLLCSRIVKDDSFSHIFVSNLFTDVIFLSNTSSVNCYVFPLRKIDANGASTWNLSPLYLDYLKNMEINLNDKDSMDPLAYIFAILFSNRFRTRYSDMLKRNFPRIPLIQNRVVVTKLIQIGVQLMKIHLLQTEFELNSVVKTNITVDDRIERGFPKYRDGFVFISPEKWFDGVSQEVWKLFIGKYQVCYKWLKDRENQALSERDIVHYREIVCALEATIPLIRIIDEILESNNDFALRTNYEVI
ncbi:MAG: N-6 DNA methylase [Candidatus Helarchaeota archaeon]|nr:N-6 DNA methylase [Candidatus Helarchaeota archaeon]